MLAEKTVLLPVPTDEAFALITEPDRLRRWKTVSARVDLRAGWPVSLDRDSGQCCGRYVHRGGARSADRLRVWMGRKP